MELLDFLKIIKNDPTRWVLKNKTIRSFDGGTPSTKLTPLLVACINVSGYRGQNFAKFGEFYEQGQFLGLSDPDTHAIFTVTDNEITLLPSWDQLSELERANMCMKNEEEYHFWYLRSLRIYNLRQSLLQTCKLKRES